jgi:hypothetical protein
MAVDVEGGRRPGVSDHHSTDSATNFKVKSRGGATDTTGRHWTLQAFIKVPTIFDDEEPQVLDEWVRPTVL